MARRKKNLPKLPKPPPAPLVWTWSDAGWTARIVEDEDGGGWAVSMTRDGDDLPVLVVPWVMGRNKKDPKPLNAADFRTQLKAARDFLRRAEHQRRMAHRKSFRVQDPEGGVVTVVFDIEADEFEPVGVLTAEDDLGDELARHELPPGFQLRRDWARQWVAAGLPRPAVD